MTDSSHTFLNESSQSRHTSNRVIDGPVLVSIIIPVHNRWDLTSACLQSISANTPEAHEIIVVDDNSDAAEAELLNSFVKRCSNISIIRNEQSRSFSFNNNQAADRANGRYLCLLNNDTLVTPGWLSALVAVAEREERVGVIGNKHLFPDNGLLHHCGIGFDTTSRPWHLHPHTDPTLPAVNYQRDLQAVSFACVLIPKEVYRELQGLDEKYNTSYEDVDFCLRAKKLGKRIIYTPASLIYHYGQSTPGRKLNDKVNEGVFLQGWGGIVDTDLERLNKRDNEYNAAESSRPRLKPDEQEGFHLAFDLSQANSFAWVAAELAIALAARGEKVSIPRVHNLSPSFGPAKAEKLRSLMTTVPHRSYHIKLNHYWDSYLRQPIYGEVNAEFFLTNYRFNTRPGDIDSWMRHVVANGTKKLAPSKFCKDCLLDVGVNEADIGMVPLGYSPEIDELFPKDLDLAKNKAGRSGKELKLLAITNSHDVQRMGGDLLIRALAEAFGPNDPVVIHIHDYGASSGNKTLRELAATYENFPRVFWHDEFLPKEDLLNFISQMDAVIAPFRGEGFSMKVLDCLALGVPVLMPAFSGVLEFAAPGTFIPLPYNEVPMGECYDTDHFDIGPGAYWCEVEHEGFVQALRDCLSDREKLIKIGGVAREHVRGRFSWDASAQALISVLKRWGSERLEKVSLGRGPSEYDISVVIPTKDRVDVLEETLEGYRLQTLERDKFEIIIINDHGDSAELTKAVTPYLNSLNLSVFENHGSPGPANARNAALRKARGEIVFITGDDIIPTPELLSKHLEAHREFPALETAFIGRSPWHPAIPQNWMMDHMIGAGAQQFNYHGLADKCVAPFDRLFTSNVSLKRSFIAEFEQMFNPIFRFAALEDIEAAYRLHLRGLELRFLDRAIGLHRHPMTIRSFLERQRKVGRMLKVFCDVQPPFAPQEHYEYLKFFDVEYRRRREGAPPPRTTPPSASKLLDLFVETIEGLDAWENSSIPANRWVGNRCKEEESWLTAQMLSCRLKLFNTACDVMMRIGMAEEWAMDIPERQFAKDWILAFGFSRIATQLAGHEPIVTAPSISATQSHFLEARYREWLSHVAKSPTEALVLVNRELGDIGSSVETLSGVDRKLESQIEVLTAELHQLRAHVVGHDNWISSFSIKERAFGKVGRIKHKLKSIFLRSST